MLTFVFEIAVFVGLAGIIILVLRVLPKISNEVFEPNLSKFRTHELTLMVEKADVVLKAWFEKFLRRLKVFLLKADNAVTEKIEKVADDRIIREKTAFIPEVMKEEGVAITEEGGLIYNSEKEDKNSSEEQARLVSISAGENDEPPMEIVATSKKRGRKKKVEL